MCKLDITLPHNLCVGDRVRILKLTNDSGNATDLFGVEEQLSGWVNCYYFEEFEGVVEFDLNTLMIVVRGKFTKIPLSTDTRYNLYINDYEYNIKKEELETIKNEFNLKDYELATIVDYVVKF